MNRIVVSAPGKIILSGEHAVVYGKEAVAFSIDLQTTCALKLISDTNDFAVTIPDLNFERKWKYDDLEKISKWSQDVLPCMNLDVRSTEIETLIENMEHVLLNDVIDANTKLVMKIIFLMYFICSNNTDSKHGHSLSWTSQLPISAGLGSSASFAVTVVTSFLVCYHMVSNKQSDWSSSDYDLINYLSNQMEVLTHGTPSGIDAAISTHGHCLSFKNGELKLLEELYDVNLRILVVNTNQKRSTKQLVTMVRDKRNQYGELYDSLMNSIAVVTKEIKQQLHNMCRDVDNSKYITELEHLIDMNQHLLEAIGVSHPTITNILQVCRAHALHGKLTGAGGGGCVIVILPNHFTDDQLISVQRDLKEKRFESWLTKLGGCGVKLHQNDKNI